MTYPIDHAAEVRAHNRVMRYRRWGAGPLVLLLGDSRDDLWPGLVERLAAHFKIIVPDLPKGETDVASWLHCFLDGLGATDVAVAAVGPHSDVASALAQGDNVSRVVLLPRDISLDEAISRIKGDVTNGR